MTGSKGLRQVINDIHRSPSQKAVMMYLLETTGPVTAKEIAEKLVIPISRVHVVLHRLGKRNLVTKVSHGTYEPNLRYLVGALLDEHFARGV